MMGKRSGTVPGRLRVMAKRCDECLLTRNRVVSDERVADILAQCAESGRAFECHKATIVGEHLVCRGFYDETPSLVCNLGKELGLVEFVELKEER